MILMELIRGNIFLLWFVRYTYIFDTVLQILKLVRSSLGLTQLPFQRTPVVNFSGGNFSAREFAQPPPYSTEIMNEWSYTSIFPSFPSWCGHKNFAIVLTFHFEALIFVAIKVFGKHELLNNHVLCSRI